MQIETTSFEPAANADETKAALDELMRAFETFKDSNDARLEEIEKNASADVLLEDKVDRLNDELSRLTKLVQRPALDTPRDRHENTEQRAAFSHYLRTGDANMEVLRETKDFDLNNTSSSSFLVPEALVTELNTQLASRSVMRQLATVKQITVGSALQYVRNTTNAGASWLTNDRTKPTKTTTPTFVEEKIDLHEVYSLQKASKQFLEDVDVDVEAWLVDSMLAAFADAEASAFIGAAGDGSSISGLQEATKAANGSATATQVGFIKSGAAGDLNPTGLYEKLLELVFELKPRYRQNAVFLMNGATQGDVRKMKDSANHYLWMPAQGQNLQPNLMGFPVYEESYMPDVVAGAYPIAFGDFKQAYVIVDKPNTGLLRDPYSAQPYVQFLMSRRVGGKVVDTFAYHFLKVAA